MRIKDILFTLILSIFVFIGSFAQQIPLVYDVENTGADYPKPSLPSSSGLPTIQSLPDPFAWADGRGRISNFSDWKFRRAEISAQVQFYEIGYKPAPPSYDNIQVSLSQDTLKITIQEGSNTLILTAVISLPTSGSGPFPAVIGVGFGGGTGSLPADIFTGRGIATITYNFSQVAPWTQSGRGLGGFYKLYPDPKVGYFAAWAWGVSRIIDGLERVPQANIDLKHLAITGCSFAGKIALFSGALDERIALTITQEPGGGGDATWRFSQTIGSSVEILANAQSYGWYHSDVNQFNNAVTKLPFDHHEVMAMIAPRALFVIGNPSMIWLADESGYVGCKAAHEIWKALGVPDRFGFSKVGHSDHCNLPAIQKPEVGAFVDKFLLGKDTTNTNISTNPGYTTDLNSWITWTTPTLSNGISVFEWASLSYPSDLQTGLDTNITFRWNKVQNAEKYFIQVSLDPGFSSIEKSDSTVTDTVTTISGLSKTKRYYWRVKVQSSIGVCLWSNVWSFITTVSLPTVPQLVSATPTYPNRADYITLKWRKLQDVDQYYVQLSKDQTFATVLKASATTDTVRNISGLTQGDKYYWRVQAKNFVGTGPWSEVWNFVASVQTDVEESAIPTEYFIGQNYPNPFNPTTKIKFALPKTSQTKIVICDLLGRELQTLVNKELEMGYHEIMIDGNNFTSGVYFYRIQAGDFIQTRKMILTK